MSGKKHLFVIHGRSTKPSEKEKRRVVKTSLLHGMRRVDVAAAAKIDKPVSSGGVKFSFIYYGDLSNELILEMNPSKKKRLTGNDENHDNKPCEPDGFYDEGLEALFAVRNHTKASYKAFLKKYPDRRWMDNAASVVSFLGNLVGLSDNIVSAATADMGAYLLTRRWGSEIRDRLQRPLKKALKDGDDICLVAHSMGCIVSYDVLWKFSRMSEYDDVRYNKNRVNKWITLGNPLGDPAVRKNLYDAHEREDGRYPSGIIKDWVNLSAQDDFICHDPTIRNDFIDMKKRGHVDSIVDKKMYNLWIGATATNPHKFYGYLDNPAVAREIIDWINAA